MSQSLSYRTLSARLNQRNGAIASFFLLHLPLQLLLLAWLVEEYLRNPPVLEEAVMQIVFLLTLLGTFCDFAEAMDKIKLKWFLYWSSQASSLVFITMFFFQMWWRQGLKH